MSETNRLEAFSDGVIAIAITLLVLDLRVPSAATTPQGTLASTLAEEWPTYAAYVTSFLIIGIIWVNHHGTFQLVDKIDRLTLFLNLALLMAVVAIPFTTSLLAEYLRVGGHNARTAGLVYSGVMLAMSLSFSGLYTHLARRSDSLAKGVDPVLVRRSIIRFSAVGSALYLLTLVVALFSAPACLIAHFLIAMYYCYQQIRFPGER